MSSTEFNIGLSGAKNSSRVLKPPGGGHSDIFGAPDTHAPGPRAKYDQQNSSNLNFCMNTTDPNVLVEKCTKPAAAAAAPIAAPANNGAVANGIASSDNGRSSSADSIGSSSGSQKPAEQAKPNRVPPGGFSSGLW